MGQIIVGPAKQADMYVGTRNFFRAIFRKLNYSLFNTEFMKSTTVLKSDFNGTIACRTLLLTAFKSRGKFTNAEVTALRERIYPKLIADSTMTMRSGNDFGESLQLFDYYIIDQLNFVQRLRHGIRMVATAIKDYVGISTVVVVLKN